MCQKWKRTRGNYYYSTIFIGAHLNMCTSHVIRDTCSVCYPFGDIKEAEEEHPESLSVSIHLGRSLFPNVFFSHGDMTTVHAVNNFFICRMCVCVCVCVRVCLCASLLLSNRGLCRNKHFALHCPGQPPRSTHRLYR